MQGNGGGLTPPQEGGRNMKITATEAINGIVENVLEVIPDISKKKAKELVIESLIYNCVIDEIVGQVEFLYNNEEVRV